MPVDPTNHERCINPNHKYPSSNNIYHNFLLLFYLIKLLLTGDIGIFCLFIFITTSDEKYSRFLYFFITLGQNRKGKSKVMVLMALTFIFTSIRMPLLFHRGCHCLRYLSVVDFSVKHSSKGNLFGT